MKSEAEVQAEVRKRAGELGIVLMRNNVGVTEDETGRTVRYGLMNDSAALNRRIKSSDLIGFIGEAGWTRSVWPGQFIAAECKHEEWKFPRHWEGLTPDRVQETYAGKSLKGDNARTLAQWRFHELVRKHGGVAGFVTSVADFERLIGL